MTADPRLQTRADSERDLLRRVVAYQSEVTYFGGNGVLRSVLSSVAGLAAAGPMLLRALIRRFSLTQATGNDLISVLEERGTPLRGSQRSQVLLLLTPHVTIVMDITTGMSSSDVEVEGDTSAYAAADTIRIVSADGSVTEVATIDSVGTPGGGPNGGTVITTTTPLVETFSPGTERVACLLRYTLPAESQVSTNVGVAFQTLSSVTVGDANPVLAGESTALALGDKVWAECTTKGSQGNIDPLQVTGFASSTPKIAVVSNPESATDGADVEPEYEAKYRAAYYPSMLAQDTAASLLAKCHALNEDVLRLIPTSSPSQTALRVRVLTRQGGALSTNAKLALQAGLDPRLPSLLTSQVLDVIPTAVEVTATITLLPGFDLTDVWLDVCNRLAVFLDYRTWPFGEDVDDADLLAILNETPGVGDVDVDTFTPTSNVVVGAESVPRLTRVVITDATSGAVRGADLSTSYA